MNLVNPYLYSVASLIPTPNFGFGLQNIGTFSSNVVRARDNGVGEADYSAISYKSISTVNDVLGVTLYNQGTTGITNELTQTTATAQPKGYTSGTLEIDSNGNPILVADGSNDFFSSNDNNLANLINGQSQPAFSVINVISFNGFSTGKNQVFWEWANISNTNIILRNQYNNSTGELRIFGRDKNRDIYIDNKYFTPSLNTQYIIETYFNGSNIQIYINGVQELSTTLGTWSSSTINIFSYGSNRNGNNVCDADLKELQIFDSDVSADRSDIYTGIYNRWS